MTWPVVEDSAIVPLRILNSLLGIAYPPEGLIGAVLDTGFTGFLLVPGRVFRELHLHELKTTNVKAVLADENEILLKAAPGSISIPAIDFTSDGLIETAPKIKELLIGMRGLRGLRAAVNGCQQRVSLEKC